MMWLAAGQATAQQDPLVPPSTDIVVVDMVRLFEESEYMKGRMAAFNVKVNEFKDENNRLEEELEAEEMDLVQKRANLPYEEFRVLVDAFNEKVQRIRSDRDKGQYQNNQSLNQINIDFSTKVMPILEELLKDSGASVMLFKGEQNSFLVLPKADITDVAIERVNEKLGDGSFVPQ